MKSLNSEDTNNLPIRMTSVVKYQFLNFLFCKNGPNFCQVDILELKKIKIPFNNRFFREWGTASILKIEYQVFLYIFLKNSAMATLGLNEMDKIFWGGWEKCLPCWLLVKTKLRQANGQTFFPSFPKEFSHFLSIIREP